MMPRLKFLVQRHYSWIVVLAIIGALAYLVTGVHPRDWGVMATGFGVVLSSVFLLQKQKLEELRLFQELFKEFNARYDALNERLMCLRSSGDEPSGDDNEALVDYFNLCGEEFFYYQAGYIPPVVWQAWHNGMRWYREHPGIRAIWDEELKTSSYYGLRFDS